LNNLQWKLLTESSLAPGAIWLGVIMPKIKRKFQQGDVGKLEEHVIGN